MSSTWVFASSSVAAVKHRDTEVLKLLAEEFNLTYTAFGSEISIGDGTAAGTLTLTDAWGAALEPAPVTPTGEDSAPWQLLSGTVKATYNAHRSLEGAHNIFVSPGIMSGNTGECTLPVSCDQPMFDIHGTGTTDTRHYWNLTRHIVRYNHHNGGNGRTLPNGVHTVNERRICFIPLFQVWSDVRC